MALLGTPFFRFGSPEPDKGFVGAALDRSAAMTAQRKGFASDVEKLGLRPIYDMQKQRTRVLNKNNRVVAIFTDAALREISTEAEVEKILSGLVIAAKATDAREEQIKRAEKLSRDVEERRGWMGPSMSVEAGDEIDRLANQLRPSAPAVPLDRRDGLNRLREYDYDPNDFRDYDYDDDDDLGGVENTPIMLDEDV
jgi:hypothetical protein